MKRISALICLMIMAVSMLAPASFAAQTNENAGAGAASLTLESSTPENGAKNVSVENLSVKIYFSEDVIPKTKAIRKSNAKAFKLTDENGKNIPVKVYYSHKETGLLMVVSETQSGDYKIDGNANYTLTIGKAMQAASGSHLAAPEIIKFKTLNQKQSTTVYMVLMVIMMVGMIFFTSRSTKKAMEKENQSKSKQETVNPYKEAKRTGKSVEEIVHKDQERKAKQAAALAKKKAEEEEYYDFDDDEPEPSGGKRVAGPRPISAAGSKYKVTVVKTQPEKKASSTNPKNQSGKQKNAKNKGKKKK